MTGSVGVLVRAKTEGLIPAIKAPLEAMKAGGAWLGDDLLAAVLKSVGEA